LLNVIACLLAATVGVLLALTVGSIGRGKREQRAWDFIASQQRTLQGLDADSYAAKQLKQQIEAEVLLLSNNLVHPAMRRRYAFWGVGACSVIVVLLMSYVRNQAPTQLDGVVTAFGVGFFGIQAFGALRVVLHRNKIRPLLESGHPADPASAANEAPAEEPPSPAPA
jgi:hypothetical protein